MYDVNCNLSQLYLKSTIIMTLSYIKLNFTDLVSEIKH